MPFDVFISYPHQDKTTADAACSALEAAGIRCWIAPRDVPPGSEWAGAIVNAINQCRVMVVIFSSGTNQSKQIYREVQRAFERGTPVIPFRIENVDPANSLAFYMGPVHWLDALTPPLGNHLKRLVTSVNALLQSESGVERQTSSVTQEREVSPATTVSRQANLPPNSSSSSSSKWLFATVTVISLAAVASVGLWTFAQRPPATVPQSAPSSEQPPENKPVSHCVSPICGTWSGSGNLAFVDFGGSPYCRYKVTLENPQLSASIDEYGTVTGATLSVRMVESIVGTCPYPPLGTKSHSYLGTGTIQGRTISLGLNPAPDNQPQASATFNGEVMNGRLVGTLTVHRIYNTPILAWTVQSQTK